MPTEWEQSLHDLVAAIRAACTALADPTSDISLNADVGVGAYTASPTVAIGIVAQMSALRLERWSELRPDDDPFPRAQLIDLLPRRVSTSRPSVDARCIDFLEDFVLEGGPDGDLVQGLIDSHGMIAFMRLAHIHNLVGQLLVEVDPEVDSLAELMTLEALADETEFMTWED